MDKKEQKISEVDARDLLMQSVVEKLEGMELLLQILANQKSQVDLSAITGEIAAFKKDILAKYLKSSLVGTMFTELNQNLVKLQQQLLIPRDYKIEHKHHFHKGVWLNVGLSVIVLLLVWGWMDSYASKKKFEENSIKYRFLKVLGNKSVLKLCAQTDSLYNRGEDQFSDLVDQAEQRRFSTADSIRLAGEKKEKHGH
ncbi:MAG: hypothetical protein ABI581_05845 [Sediminibacterium sp.]